MTWELAFRAHAFREAPRECCGLLTLQEGAQVYEPCLNLSEDPDEFRLDPRDQSRIEALHQVIAVCHSHPRGPGGLTEYDRLVMQQEQLAWYVLDMTTGLVHTEFSDGHKAPLIGRKFVYGAQDCYTLVRDYYAQELGIPLPDYFRQEGWEDRGENLYLDNFQDAGFGRVDLDEARPGDILLMQIHSPVPNHAAIFIGDNQIMHHLLGRPSSREVFGGYYRKVTTHCLRNRCLSLRESN